MITLPVGWTHLVCVSAFALSASDVLCGAPPVVSSVDELLQTLESAETAASCGRFVWDEQVVFYADRSMSAKSGESVPASDVTFSISGVALQFASGKEILYEHYLLGPESDPAREPPKASFSFDGSLVASYDTPSLLPYGQGILRSGDDFGEYNNFNIWPFLLVFRAVDRHGIGLRTAALSLESVDGKPSDNEAESNIILKWQGANGFRRIAFSRSSDALRLARAEQWYEPGGDKPPTLSADIVVTEWIRDESGVFVPERWAVRQFDGPRGVRKRSECQLASYSVNRPESLKTFSLFPFPEGTLVVDERNGSVGWQRGDHVEVVSSGKQDEPAPKIGPGNENMFWLLLVNGLALLLVCLAYFLRRARGRSA